MDINRYIWNYDNIRVLFAPYSSAYLQSFQGLLRLAFSQPLAPPYKLLRLITLPPLLVYLYIKLLPTLITISSSFINSLVIYTWLICSLLYTLSNYASHLNRFYTFAGGNQLAADLSSFAILHFLFRIIIYIIKQLHQQASGRSHLLIIIN